MTQSQIAPPSAKARPMGAVAPLSRREKAAIVVQLLLSNGASLPLTALPDHMQADLTRQIGTMRPVNQATLTMVAAEFLADLESLGLSFPGNIEGALSLLADSISEQSITRLRHEESGGRIRDPWQQIAEYPAEQLLHLLAAESEEIAAVILSKLDVAKAAELLGLMPGPRARRITFAISKTSAVTPGAVEKIGDSLARQLAQSPQPAFSSDPGERLGAILNVSPAVTRDDVLNGLRTSDAGFASAVEKAIFTFKHIPLRVAPRDVSKIIRRVEQTVLVTALQAATTGGLESEANFLLANISQRMADALREEMQELGELSEKDSDSAMSKIIATIRDLEKQGEITLLDGPE